MRRGIATMATGLVLVGLLTGCQSEEERCEENYIEHQEQLTGLRPTELQADRACDRESTRSYYGGMGSRGGGSGFGK